MKAIQVHQFGDPQVMKLEDVTDLQPAPTQVVIKVYAVGVNPVDTYIRAGWYPIAPSLPYTPGFEAAGIVEAIGKNVKTIQVGQRVFIAGTLSGAYAEKTLCDAWQILPLPNRYNFEQGASIYSAYATAYRALFQRAAARAGETILIHGASGGVGLATLQWARTAGMTIIATAGSEKGRRLIAEEGADHVLDHHDPDHCNAIRQLTDGRGVNVILEMLANVNLDDDLKILAKYGRVVIIGSRGPIQIDPRDTMSRDTSILGMSMVNASPDNLTVIRAAITAALDHAMIDPVVGRELPLADASRAHQEIIEAKAHGKIILVP